VRAAAASICCLSAHLGWKNNEKFAANTSVSGFQRAFPVSTSRPSASHTRTSVCVAFISASWRRRRRASDSVCAARSPSGAQFELRRRSGAKNSQNHSPLLDDEHRPRQSDRAAARLCPPTCTAGRPVPMSHPQKSYKTQAGGAAELGRLTTIRLACFLSSPSCGGGSRMVICIV
jgi:hypothetical protein